MKTFYFQLPGDFTALSIEASNERHAREKIRAFLGMKRLPNNMPLWCN